ncbi:MAG: aminotransferase class V-fold PLP-dependent enzyme [Vicinamibacterales bacterium]
MTASGANGPDRWRRDFPILARELDGRPLVYLDSAATSLKPQAVLDAERRYATDLGANIHRSQHRLGEDTSLAYEEARATVAHFLGTRPSCLVFTRNTTESLNLVAHGLGLTPADRVLVPHLGEHHSNLLPWMQRATLVDAGLDPMQPIDPQELALAIERHQPRVVAFGAASHVTGIVQPIAEVCALAREHGVLSVVDAAQLAPHAPLEVDASGCDFVAASGHKMLGPTGIGVLAGREDALEQLAPLLWGGGMVDRVARDAVRLKGLPGRLEAGTPNIAGALGLAAACEYVERCGWASIAEHERSLAFLLRSALEAVPGVRVLGDAAATRVPIATVVFETDDVTPFMAERLLSDAHNVMVRAGFHCAHPFFDERGFTSGGLRASAHLYTTADDITRFASALAELLARLGARTRASREERG